jgi:protein-tyrosine phosphatase
MVCLGNICRSPLAEGVLQQMANQKQLNWEVASAGTGNWHVGQAPDPRSIAVAKKHGYDISKQKALYFNPSFFNHYDCILVMDKNNLKDVISLANTTEGKKKVKLFLANDAEVPDPYYNDALFDPVFKVIENQCKLLITTL